MIGLLLLGIALLAWPATSLRHMRLGALAAAGRLGRHGKPTRIRRRRPAIPSGGVICGVTIGIGVALWPLAGIGVAASFVAATLAVAAVIASVRRAQRNRRDLDALVATLHVLRSDLEAGLMLPDALRAASAVSDRFASAFTEAAAAAASGRNPGTALSGSGDALLRPLAGALAVSIGTGAPAAELVDRVTSDLATRRTQDRRVQSALAGPLSSAVLLACLPLVGLGLGRAMGAHPIHVLIGTGAGQIVLAAGVLLDALGVLWTVWLVERARTS